MNKWDELRNECYGKDTLERYQNGRIDFSPDSMRDVENDDFKSYDEYLEVQKRSCDKERFETLKNFQPGKFTPFTVMLAYELEYRVLMQDKNFRCDPTDPNFPIIKRMLDICQAHPVYYVGNPQEAFIKMLISDKSRMYIE